MLDEANARIIAAVYTKKATKAGEIVALFKDDYNYPERTVHHRLKKLVDDGILARNENGYIVIWEGVSVGRGILLVEEEDGTWDIFNVGRVAAVDKDNLEVVFFNEEGNGSS